MHFFLELQLLLCSLSPLHWWFFSNFVTLHCGVGLKKEKNKKNEDVHCRHLINDIGNSADFGEYLYSFINIWSNILAIVPVGWWEEKLQWNIVWSALQTSRLKRGHIQKMFKGIRCSTVVPLHTVQCCPQPKFQVKCRTWLCKEESRRFQWRS